MAKLEKLSCELCLPDIESYYDVMADILDFNYRMMSFDEARRRKGSKQLLQCGRLVVLVDGVSPIFPPAISAQSNLGCAFQYFKGKLAVVLRESVAPASTDGVQTKDKTYEVLALVDPATKEGKQGLPIWCIAQFNQL